MSCDPTHYSPNPCCQSWPSHCHLSNGRLQEGPNWSPHFLVCAAHLQCFPQRAASEKLLNIIRSRHSLDSSSLWFPRALLSKNKTLHHGSFPPLHALLVPPPHLSLGFSHTGILSAPPAPQSSVIGQGEL